MNVRFNYPFQSTKISLDTDRTCSFEYSSMRSLISGAHGNQHSPELTTPTQWKDSALLDSKIHPKMQALDVTHAHSSLYLLPHNYTPCIQNSQKISDES